MKRNMMRKNLQQSILRSLGRYLAIVAIIALGCGIFVGLRITKTDMIATGQEYTDSQNMFDLQLLNTYGWNKDQVEQIAKMEGIADAEGSIYLDAFAGFEGGEESVYRLYSIPQRINQVYLLGGRMPEGDDECLVDGDLYGEDALGTEIVISGNNEEGTLDSLKHHTYTVVGYVSTPLYMDMTRGSTSLGSGTVTSYIYLPEDAFDVDYYTEIYATIDGTWEIYSEEYDDAMDSMAEQLEVDLVPLANERFDDVLTEAEKQYADGRKEYEDGLAEFEDGKAEAEQTLADALAELEAAQKELDDGLQQLADGEKQIQDAQILLDEGRAELNAGKVELENAKSEAYAQMAEASAELFANYKVVTESLALVNDGLKQLDDGIAQIDGGLQQINDNLPMLELMLGLLDTQLELTQSALEAAKLTGNEELIAQAQARLDEQTAQYNEYQAQMETALQTKTELEETKAELVAQRNEVAVNHKTLTDALSTIEMGFKELETNKAAAENQFASAEAQINAGLLELEAGQAELDAKKAELEAGKADLLDGQIQLEQGWADYEAGKAEAEAELAEAEAQLADAKAQLDDARNTLDEMAKPDVFALTRNSNAGYVALDSNSDIVSGISRVIPVFFLLIAALVCITTITRMVEEERTQIGTLKALGYSNFAIMNKYMSYSGTASLMGCAVGIAVGCTFFPNLLWNAYGILFNIRPNVALVFDWPLCLGISVGYIAVSSAVTWYCCRRTLREVPAELIRPKAPAAGKKILLEYLPFWKKLSFLNKVMLRNVVRYRQRFLMMLIGIGGCTALLLTGFGLRDTIVDIANVQFEKVNHFDYQVYFSQGQTPEAKEQFLQQLEDADITDEAGFFYQTSVEVEFEERVRDTYLMCTDDSIKDYITFSWDDEELGMPDTGDCFLSVGVTELLGISLGDRISVRNSDMQTMELTVTGIYENHVNNYVVVTPETVAEHWGEVPLDQMAFILTDEGVDIQKGNAELSEMNDVISVVVCEDSADMVNRMMDALNLVLGVVILSAGVLGAIVLYNLTNININERIREIATIKVLGFNAKETSAYVFKENILLTVLGTGFGLILGRIFLDFVMDNIKVDMVWFKTRLVFPSYIYAVILTLLCALLVDFIFHKKLDKINMAEALKSVE